MHYGQSDEKELEHLGFHVLRRHGGIATALWRGHSGNHSEGCEVRAERDPQLQENNVMVS